MTNLPIIKPGQVVPLTGGLVEYVDGNGKVKLLRVMCIPKPTVDKKNK